MLLLSSGIASMLVTAILANTVFATLSHDGDDDESAAATAATVSADADVDEVDSDDDRGCC